MKIKKKEIETQMQLTLISIEFVLNFTSFLSALFCRFFLFNSAENVTCQYIFGGVSLFFLFLCFVESLMIKKYRVYFSMLYYFCNYIWLVCFILFNLFWAKDFKILYIEFCCVVFIFFANFIFVLNESCWIFIFVFDISIIIFSTIIIFIIKLSSESSFCTSFFCLLSLLVLFTNVRKRVIKTHAEQCIE